MRSCTAPIFWDAGCRCAYGSTLGGKEVGSIFDVVLAFRFCPTFSSLPNTSQKRHTTLATAEVVGSPSTIFNPNSNS